MRPCSLERAAACSITQYLVDTVWKLDITRQYDRDLLVVVLLWLGHSEFRCLSFRALQKELHWVLVRKLRSLTGVQQAPVLLTCMVALCWHVRVELAYIPREFGDSEINSMCGRRLPPRVCQGILEVLERFQGKLSESGGKTAGSQGGGAGAGVQGREELCAEGEDWRKVRKLAPLHTKSLVFGAMEIIDEEFLPRLIKKMPDLQYVSLPDNTKDNVIRALIRYCRGLLGAKWSCEEDVIPFLIGIPAHHVTEDLIKRFYEGGEEFRLNFVAQFPKLKELDVRFLRKSVSILALLLHPNLEFLGRRLSYHLNDLRTILVWRRVRLPKRKLEDLIPFVPFCPPALPLKHSFFCRELCREIVHPISENMVRIFHTLRCIEFDDRMAESEYDIQILQHLISRFSSSDIKAMSLPNIPLSNVSRLAFLHHLRITGKPVDNIHLILSCCPCLCTLSLQKALSYQQGEPDRHSHTTHTKLTTLRIGCLVVMEEEPIEAFLHTLLKCLPDLCFLCLGWLDQELEDSNLTTALNSVLTQAALTHTPFLTYLEELCCRPLDDLDCLEEDIHNILLSLVDHLPALSHMTLPESVDEEMLELYFACFRTSHVELKFKCGMEKVFYILNPHEDA